MTHFERGDVVLVDLGYLGKIRPCVVISVDRPDRDRNMSIVVPLTTERRGGQCDVPFAKPPWLRQESVVNVLGIAGIDNARIMRRLAPFPPETLTEIYLVLGRALGSPMF